MSQEKAITSTDDAANEETMKSGENTMIGNRASQEPDEVDQKDLTSVVQGTAETLLSKLEETVAATTISNRSMPFGKQITSKKKGKIDTAKEAKEGQEDMEEDDYDEEEEEYLQDTNPGPLGVDGKDVEDVLSIISQSIYREGEGQLLLKLCDRSSLLSVVSHSLSAYITTLDPIPLQRLSARIAAEVSLWLCDLFNFSDGAAYCHDDTREGLVKIGRMALHKHYPKMTQDGFEALFSRPPVIYLTSNTYLDIAHHVCLQLGLPLSSVRVLNNTFSKADDDSGEVDAKLKMEEVFKEDKAAGRMPILCIANVHSSLFQSMSAYSFEEICSQHDVWLHMEGHALAGLALLNENCKSKEESETDSDNRKTIQHIPVGDSLSLTIGSWLGIPALPFVTLYKSIGMEGCAQSAGLSTVNPSVRLNCLPMWCVLRSLGSTQFRDRISNIFEMMEILNNKLSEISCLRILSQRPERGNEFVTVAELRKGGLNLGQLYRTVSPALAFQYVSPKPPLEYSNNTDDSSSGRVPTYFNNLNSWLGQTMQRDCPQIPLEIVDVETTGYVLRLCPFESLAFSGVTLTDDDLDAFIEGLENQTSILNATVCQRDRFINLISQEVRLEHIEIAHWAGLGGVSYLPMDFRPDIEEVEVAVDLNDEDISENVNINSEVEPSINTDSTVPVSDQENANQENIVDSESAKIPKTVTKTIKRKIKAREFNVEEIGMINQRNMELIQTLRTLDSAFSMGESDNGRLCIRFGMVSMETDVEELLALVINTGKQLDEQIIQLTQMSELVRKGIVQASEDLQRENDEAVWQEGVLRHVPIVGSLYNWINPLQKPLIKGRCLSLKEGKLESTESIYTLNTKIDKNDLAPLKEHTYEKQNPKSEEKTLEQSNNEINDQLNNSEVSKEEIKEDSEAEKEDSVIQENSIEPKTDTEMTTVTNHVTETESAV